MCQFLHDGTVAAVHIMGGVACSYLQINTTVTVPFYNSTTVFDDLAWGAIWLYRATGRGLDQPASPPTHHSTSSRQ
jgi:hypothetical protein